MKKACSACKKVKDLKEFYNHNCTKDGKTGQCKECMTAYRKRNAEKAKKYAKKYREGNRDIVNKKKREAYKNLEVRQKLLSQCRNRALRKGIPFNLDIEDIIIPDICPLLEVNFILGTKGNYEYTYSLDRIENDKGYIKGNVQVISKKANSMKNNATKEELITFAKNILDFYKEH